MLIRGKEQVEKFIEESRQRYYAETVKLLKIFFADRVITFSDEKLFQIVELWTSRGIEYGLEESVHLKRYIASALLLGEGFFEGIEDAAVTRVMENLSKKPEERLSELAALTRRGSRHMEE